MTRVIKPSALKRLKDTYKSPDVILAPLQRHVMRSISDNPERSTSFMHPSDLCKPDWCGRHDYFRMVDTPAEKTSQANPSFRMSNIFAEGHTIHAKYQTWLWEMGVLWGTYECLECGHRWGDLSPLLCQFCRSPRLAYREVALRRKQMMIEGHADGAVHDLDGWSGLVEVKSIGIRTLAFEAPRLYNRYQDGESVEDIWWKISRPFSSHLRQGQLYLWMAWPRYEEIVFIYESKFHQQVKEFVVGYNKATIAPILEQVRVVSHAVRAGTPPPRPDWAETPESKVCHSCPYRGTCWSIDVVTKANDPSPVRVRRVPSTKRKRVLGRTA